MTVLVDGARLDPKYRDLLHEVKVVDSLTLPDMALVRITDLKGENIDANPLKLGAKIEIKAGDMGANTTDVDLQGPDRGRGARVHAAGRRDLRSAPTTTRTSSTARSKSRTFQQMSASDMVAKVVGEAGLTAGKSSPRASSTSSSSRATRPTGTSCGGSR